MVRLHGKSRDGKTREISLDLDKLEEVVSHDAEIFDHYHHKFHSADPYDSSKQDGGIRNKSPPTEQKTNDKNPSVSHHSHRSDSHLGHHDDHEHHFSGHEDVEKEHSQHHHQHHAYATKKRPADDRAAGSTANNEEAQSHHIFKLPTGHDHFWNETLFEQLIESPYDIYHAAVGEELGYDDSFPVFNIPAWYNVTGIFTGFSRKASPLIFENAQFLLHWNDIIASAQGVSDDLVEYTEEHNFHASLIIGKSFRNDIQSGFLAMVVTYFQYGAQKNIMFPFAKLEDFFDDTSEQHLLDPNTRHLEMGALHDLIETTNSTNLYHPAMKLSDERRERLEKLETTHFQKLFQLLIRRSHLFSFGYADCLMSETSDLRGCLDDTFYSIVDMETSVRGALDDELVGELADINDTFHSKVKEVCISVQGMGGGMYGTGSCNGLNDLGAFVTSYSPF